MSESSFISICLKVESVHISFIDLIYRYRFMQLLECKFNYGIHFSSTQLHGNFVWDAFHPTTQPDLKDSPTRQRPDRPGRGSKGMHNIMMHDLTSEPNRAVRDARFPGHHRPLKPIAGKIGGQQEDRIFATDIPSAGLRHDTMPTLPPIGTNMQDMVSIAL